MTERRDDDLVSDWSGGQLDAALRGSTLPLLVEFWREACPPCKPIAALLPGLAERFEGRLRVAKLNVDAHLDIAARMRIDGLPTLVVFRDGAEVARLRGGQTRERVEAFVAAVL